MANQLVHGLLLLLIGAILNIIAANKVHHLAELRLSDPYTPLPDLIHDYLPKIPILIPDYFLLFCVCLSIFRGSLLHEIESGASSNIICTGLCFIIRSFSIFLTIFPTCMPDPRDDRHETEPCPYYAKLFLSTHDLMFSGHSLFFICIGKMLNSYIITIIGPLLLVLARQHYTIDVCVSGLVYFFIMENIVSKF